MTQEMHHLHYHVFSGKHDPLRVSRGTGGIDKSHYITGIYRPDAPVYFILISRFSSLFNDIFKGNDKTVTGNRLTVKGDNLRKVRETVPVFQHIVDLKSAGAETYLYLCMVNNILSLKA